MKKAVSCIAILLLLIIAAACGNREVPSADEEASTTIHEEPTSSYAELASEIERLKQLFYDNNIDSRKERHPIDVSMFEELEKPENMTTMGMAITVDKYGDIWKAEMEKYYDLLLEELTADHKQLLIASQKNWEAFIDDNNDLEYQILFYACFGGTMMHNIAASNYYEKYRQRALFLIYLYKQAGEDYQSYIAYQEYLASTEND